MEIGRHFRGSAFGNAISLDISCRECSPDHSSREASHRYPYIDGYEDEAEIDNCSNGIAFRHRTNRRIFVERRLLSESWKKLKIAFEEINAGTFVIISLELYV